MLPREIQAEHWPDRNTYNLPMRPIGKLRWLGLLPIGFALLFASVPLKMVSGSLTKLLHGTVEPAEVVFLLFPLVFILVALVPFGLGLFLLMGRTRVVVTRDFIKVTNLALFFRKSRKLRVADIDHVAVVSGATQSNGAAGPAWLARLGALGAAMRDGKKRLLLLGYPSDWLQGLADDISSFTRFQGAGLRIEQAEPLRREQPVPLADLAEAPPKTNIVRESLFNGVKFDVPPIGLRGNSRGLFVIGVVWCVIVGAITFAVARADRHGFPVPVLLFLLVFWAIGLVMVYGSLRMARRRASIRATGSELQVSQRVAFATKEYRWQRSQLAAIRADESGMKINEQPVLELQVRLTNGTKTGLVAGRSADELRWLATEIRKALNLPSGLESPAELPEDAPPARDQ